MTTELVTQPDFADIIPGDHAWGRVTANGLQFNPTTTFPEWERVAKTAAAFYQGSHDAHVHSMFLLADALEFGEKMFGEEYAQVIDQTRAVMKLNAKTIENAAWIARSVPVENRHLNLTFAHHEAVARLEPKDQIALLDKAESEGLTVAALKKEVKIAHPKTPSAGSGDKPPKPVTAEACEKALETALQYFAYLGEKRAKLTDEDRERFAVQMQELQVIAGKWGKK